MPLHKRILEFHEPDEGEPLCSGPEFSAVRGQQLNLSHFHTVVSVINKAKSLFGSRTEATLLDCSVSINGRRYERQSFTVRRDDIGKTLFCAGFPCLTLTGIDNETGEVALTISEIVEPCE